MRNIDRILLFICQLVSYSHQLAPLLAVSYSIYDTPDYRTILAYPINTSSAANAWALIYTNMLTNWVISSSGGVLPV